jgi:hypothetical protein
MRRLRLLPYYMVWQDSFLKTYVTLLKKLLQFVHQLNYQVWSRRWSHNHQSQISIVLRLWLRQNQNAPCVSATLLDTWPMTMFLKYIFCYMGPVSKLLIIHFYIAVLFCSFRFFFWFVSKQICLFWLFQNGSETPKQAEKIIYRFHKTNQKLTERDWVSVCFGSNRQKRFVCFEDTLYRYSYLPELVFLKIHGARCGVEKGTQMGGLLGGEGWNSFLLV